MSSKRKTTENLKNAAKRLLLSEEDSDKENIETVKENKSSLNCCLNFSRCVDVLKTGHRVKDLCEDCIQKMFKLRVQKTQEVEDFLQDFMPKFKMAVENSETISSLQTVYDHQFEEMQTFLQDNQEKIKLIEAMIEEFSAKILVHKQKYDETVTALLYGEEMTKQLKDSKVQNDLKDDEIRKKYQDLADKLDQKTTSQLEILKQLEEEEAQIDEESENLSPFHEQNESLIEDSNMRVEYSQNEISEEIHNEEPLQELIDTLKAQFEILLDENQKISAEEDKLKRQHEDVDAELDKLQKAVIVQQTEILIDGEEIANFIAEHDVLTKNIKNNEYKAKYLQDKIECLSVELTIERERIETQVSICKNLEAKTKRFCKEVVKRENNAPELNKSLDSPFRQFKPSSISTVRTRRGAKSAQLLPKIDATLPKKRVSKKKNDSTAARATPSNAETATAIADIYKTAHIRKTRSFLA